jgi:hypothetical protein
MLVVAGEVTPEVVAEVEIESAAEVLVVEEVAA